MEIIDETPAEKAKRLNATFVQPLSSETKKIIDEIEQKEAGEREQHDDLRKQLQAMGREVVEVCGECSQEITRIESMSKKFSCSNKYCPCGFYKTTTLTGS